MRLRDNPTTKLSAAVKFVAKLILTTVGELNDVVSRELYHVFETVSPTCDASA